MELLRNAVLGWQDYKFSGKFAALFLISILYLTLRRQKGTGEQGQIRNYSAAAGLMCIFPPTAAILMGYQTRFYDYEWIWSIVPVTALISMGGTLFLTDQVRKTGRFDREDSKKINNICYDIALVAAFLGILILSGRMNADSQWRGTVALERAEAERVLDTVTGWDDGEEICLWAPKEIMEYARALDAGIILPYGRNMWDKSLNAYSYDIYGEKLGRLYLWMEKVSENGEWDQEVESTGEIAEGTEQIRYALRQGVNNILLRDNLSEDSRRCLEELADADSLEIRQIEGFYLLKKR